NGESRHLLHAGRRQNTTANHHPPPVAATSLTDEEFNHLKNFVTDYHTYHLTPSQCSSLLAQHIHAPVDVVWSVVRRFDKPQTYKHFIKSCTVGGCRRCAGGEYGGGYTTFADHGGELNLQKLASVTEAMAHDGGAAIKSLNLR
ncbi:hypothetical protein R6Q59_032105, partial [Mikania micrantha]